MANRKVRKELARAAVEGALAGIIGGMVMKMTMKAEQKALLPEGQRMTPPPEKIVDRVAKNQGADLSPEQEKMAAMGVHLGYSALWGAVHGVGSEVFDIPPVLHGLLLGGIVYYTSMGPTGIMTKYGITPNPMMQPMRKAAIPVGAHAAYGLATAVAYEAMH